MTKGTTKICPYCANKIKLAAQKCQYCGEWLKNTSSDTSNSLIEAFASNYEILEEVGKGGMAIVYKAVQKNLDRVVALKVIPKGISIDSEFISRFNKEARDTGNLNHPNIITIHDSGELYGYPFIAMEYLPKGSLRQRINKHGKISEDEIKEVIIPVAKGLSIAHKKGIIHRDIKSSNIMFDEFNRPVLTDFGIAKSHESSDLTVAGTYIGTPEYSSPEQALSEDEIDLRTDIYSLGVIMYEMATGHVPFHGKNPVSVLHDVVNETPKSIENPEISDSLKLIISQAIAKDPKERYQNCQELVRALEEKKIKRATTIPKKSVKSFKTQRIFKDLNTSQKILLSIIVLLLAVILTSSVYLIAKLVNRSNPDKYPNMVYVENGKINSSVNYSDAKVRDFYIGKYEVTNEEYCAFLNSFTDFPDDLNKWIEISDKECLIEYFDNKFKSKVGFENHPVIEVSWEGASEYCKWKGGRLPSAKEWEFAARGGNKSLNYKYSGSENVEDIAWYSYNSNNQPQKTGLKRGNEINIHDMSGNVWEWCSIELEDDFRLESNMPDMRIIRGGSWIDLPKYQEVKHYKWINKNETNNSVGFRLLIEQ